MTKPLKYIPLTELLVELPLWVYVVNWKEIFSQMTKDDKGSLQ